MSLFQSPDIVGDIAYKLNLSFKGKGSRKPLSTKRDPVEKHRFFRVVMIKSKGIWKIKKTESIMREAPNDPK